jgi:hypothetical protein
MLLVEVFESVGVTTLGLPYGFRLGQIALFLCRYHFRHTVLSEK